MYITDARKLVVFVLIFVATAVSCVGASAYAQGKSRGGGNRAGITAIMQEFNQAIRQGEFGRAEELAREAVTRTEVAAPERAKATALGALGNALRLNGKPREAEGFLRASLAIRDQLLGRESRQAIHNIVHLAEVCSRLGKLAEADQLAHEAVQRQLKGNPHSADMLMVYATAAKMKRLLGRFDQAEALLRAGLAVEVRTQQRRLAMRRGNLHTAYAHLLLRQQRWEEAAEMARLSLDAFPDDRLRRASGLKNLIEALFKQGKLDEAEKAALEALALGEDGKRGDAGNQALLADILAAKGNVQAAETHYRRATAGSQQSVASTARIGLNRRYAAFLAKQNRLNEALALYRETLDLVDRIFAQTQGLDEAVRQNFITQYAGLYRATLSVLLGMHAADANGGHDREALSVVSRTQSRLFTEMLRQADVGKFAKDAAFTQLRERRTKLTRQIDELRQRYVTRGGAQDDLEEDGEPKASSADPIVQARKARAREELRQELADSDKELASVEAALWAKYPRYMELTQPRPMSAELLQQRLLKPGEVLLTYFMLPERLLVFSVSRERFRMVVMPQRAEEIARLIRSVRAPEEKAAGSIEALAKLDPALLNRLYQILIQPVESDLREGQRLLLIGDGPIHTLPLEMLVVRYGEAEKRAFEAARAQGGLALGEYAALPYLGERYQFAYLPSLSALASVRLYQKRAIAIGREFVSFADPVFEKEGGEYAPATRAALTLLARSVASRDTIGIIPRLPETADEARAIAQILGGRNEIYLRDKAQEHTAKTLDLRDVRYLHFATHGVLGGEFVQLKAARAGGDTGRDGERGLKLAASAQKPAELMHEEETPLGDEELEPPAPGSRGAGQPALLLTLAGNLQGEDGLLTMREVLESMDLNADLVVLSACNTAGEQADAGNGEGFAGLTRAFMYAGAKGLLVSHWSVESRATQDLITETFRRKKGSEASLAALNKARRAIAASRASLGGRQVSRAHPYFWAPFVYVGD